MYESDEDKPFTRALAMLERQKGSTPQREYNMPAAEAAPEREDWRTLLAMGLNLIGNKGRDMGQIAMAGNEAYNKRLEGWRERNSADSQLDRQAKLLSLRQGEAQLASQPIKDASQVAAGLRADDQFSESVRQFGEQQAQAGRFHNDTMADRALTREQQAQQFTQQLDSTNANARASRGLQWAGLKQAGEHYSAQDALARDQMAQQRALMELQQQGLNTRNSADIASRQAIEEAKAKHEAEKLFKTEARQYNLDTAMPQRMAGQLDRIGKVTSKYGGGDLPGVGRYDSSAVGEFFSNIGAALGTERGLDAKEINNARATLADLAQRDVSGAGGAEAEALRIQMQSGAQPGASEADFRTGIAAAQLYVEKVLSAQATGREDAASSVLQNAGMSPQRWLNAGGQQRPTIDPSAYSDIPGLRRR